MMTIARIENNEVVEYPLSVYDLRNRLPVGCPDLPADDFLFQFGYARVEPTHEGFNPLFSRLEFDRWEIVDNHVKMHQKTVYNSLDEIKSAIKDRVSEYWWWRETHGIEVNGQKIMTTRESQAMISGAVLTAMRKPTASIDYMSESGWVTVTAEQMLAIGDAVSAHVQDCFTQRRMYHEQIDAMATVEELEAFEIVPSETEEPAE